MKTCYRAIVRNQHGFVIGYAFGSTPESARAGGERVGTEALRSYPDPSWKVGRITVRKVPLLSAADLKRRHQKGSKR